MMKVRCIVVGLGSISQSMLKHLGQMPWYETVAVVDVRPDVLENAKTQLALTESALFTDLDKALTQTEADAVIINTPSELHYQQAPVSYTHLRAHETVLDLVC